MACGRGAALSHRSAGQLLGLLPRSPYLPEVTRPGHHRRRPQLNGSLALRNRFFEPDCIWDEQRLIVELDGRDVHGTHAAFESDRQRDRILLAEGWRWARVTWRQLRDEPEAIAADLRAALYS